ncbi:DUF4337 family protein [Brevundimonas sp. 2R-24]|uniref:DUF4337 family protein n=1 Tax=Peiella sedimenti TaxID=3061083 RepID=A0ABT8SKU4_9CAUL|nr:DUF4337 family protein [Caulobacteraceae bacterium XZ-24]
MSAQDVADLVHEIQEERADSAANERFRNRAALLVAALAAVLAVGGLGGGNATDDAIAANIHASDTWAFYQAKNMRQTAYEIAAADIEARLAGGSLSPAQIAADTARLEDYRATIARYDSEPDPARPGDPTAGEGKRQLAALARTHEEARATAEARDNNFDWAEILLQLAIVLASVAILATSRRLLTGAAVLGGLGALLTLNGFLLLVG